MSTLPSSTRLRSKTLRQKVVVITGASSGIGRAAAHAFTRRGAHLALAARNKQALHEVSGECADLGAHAIVVPTDVTDAHAMAALAHQTNEAFGRIDVWINNAGVGLFGPFINAGIDAHRRVVETNLFGAMNGAAAVLPYFLEQQRGVMITNISLGGFSPVPFAAAYTAGKFGLRGFMAGLRQELAHEPDVHICSVFPSVIDTPGFQHGSNVSDAALTPGPLLYPPEKVAAAMVQLALHPRDELPVGWPAYLARFSYGIAPRTTERVIGFGFRRVIKRSPPEPRRLGNLFEPSRGRMTPSGGWRQRPSRVRTLGRATVWAAGLLGTGALLVAWSRSRTAVAKSNGY